MARRIDYTATRGSQAAAVNAPAPQLLAQHQILFERGVRGGTGAIISPSVTQVFKDNYFSNQTLDAAIGAPWTTALTGAATAVARDENVLLGTLSAQLQSYTGAAAGDAAIYQVLQTAAVHTVSAYFYAPPPARLDMVKFYYGNTTAVIVPTQIVSLGGYWYFAWKTATGQNGATDRWGIYYDDGLLAQSSIWVDCLSLTQTAYPTELVPNSSTTVTATSSDDILKYSLEEPLPQSGSIAVTVMPFWLGGSAMDGYPTVLEFLPKDAAYDGEVSFLILYNNSNGYLYYILGNGTNTVGTAYDVAQKAYQPNDIVVEWDFTTVRPYVAIWLNGKCVIMDSTSDAIKQGFPNNLVDMYVGCDYLSSGTYGNHFQGLTQDVQVFQRLG